MLTSAKDSGRCQTPSGLHPLGVILSSRCHKWCQHPEERKRKPSVSPYLSGVTFAEWEYACRAGTVTAFAHGDDLSLLKKYAVFEATHSEPCGTLLPNAAGFFDMHGNVQEWCQDDRGPPIPGPVWQGLTEHNREIRGGDWRSSATDCDSKCRWSGYPSHQFGGFRVARSLSGGK